MELKVKGSSTVTQTSLLSTACWMERLVRVLDRCLAGEEGHAEEGLGDVVYPLDDVLGAAELLRVGDEDVVLPVGPRRAWATGELAPAGRKQTKCPEARVMRGLYPNGIVSTRGRAAHRWARAQ